MVKINKQIIYILYILIIIFIIYTFKLKYMIIIIPLILFVFIHKLIKNTILIYYYIFLIYMLLSLFISFVYNKKQLILMDSKILFFILMFYLGYLLSGKIKIKFFFKAYTYFSLLFPLISIYIYFNYDMLLWGNRDDLGVFIVLINVINLYAYFKQIYSKYIFIYLTILNLITLAILHGRTALISYLMLFILFFIYQSKCLTNKMNIKIKILFLLFIGMIFYIAYMVFIDRISGTHSTLENEARYLSSILFFNIIDKSSIIHLLFGYGYGAHYENFASNIPLIQPHVHQIMNSAGGYYVSWGFHNAIYRNILMFGLIGSFLFYKWQFLLFYNYINKYNKNVKELKCILKIFVLITFFVSFSNGIYGITLISPFIFFTEGFITKKIILGNKEL